MGSTRFGPQHLPMRTQRLIDFLVEALRAPVWQ